MGKCSLECRSDCCAGLCKALRPWTFLHLERRLTPGFVLPQGGGGPGLRVRAPPLVFCAAGLDAELLLPTVCCSPPALCVPTLSPGAVSLFLLLIRLLGADRCPYSLLIYPCPLTQLSLHVFHGHVPPLPRSWSPSYHVPCTHLTGLALSPAQATSAFLSLRALIQPSF